MEFLIGALFSMVISIATLFIFNKFKKKNLVKIKNRQTTIFEIVKPAIYMLEQIKERKPTQAMNYLDRDKVKVVVLEDKAYWIKDNAVFEASFANGFVDQDDIKVVDTMGMDKVELDRLSYIVDKLTKGDNNDRGYPGYQKF